MAIHTLSLDVETFSDVDLKKCGVYKYAESSDFEILLFGVSGDGGEVTVYDLASGDTVPEEIIRALADDSVIKWAYNASFERVCLSVWLRRNYPQYFSSYSIEDDTVRNYLDPSSWRCSLVWGAYMGLPLSLEGIGKVLKLENQKMAEGKALIRYFCVPCKPTKANGGRMRNRAAGACRGAGTAPAACQILCEEVSGDAERRMHGRQGERDVPVLRRKPQRPLGGQTDSVTEPTAEPHGTSGGREKPCPFRGLRPALCTV